MDETMIVLGLDPVGEYYCRECNQLRLSYVEMTVCKNCFSPNIVKGAIGTLDKAKLQGEKP